MAKQEAQFDYNDRSAVLNGKRVESVIICQWEIYLNALTQPVSKRLGTPCNCGSREDVEIKAIETSFSPIDHIIHITSISHYLQLPDYKEKKDCSTNDHTPYPLQIRTKDGIRGDDGIIWHTPNVP